MNNRIEKGGITMKKDLFKRVGMLTAATAACYGVVFGGLSLNGLRYVRPTAETWRVLPYVKSAARIEQETEYLAKNDGRQRFNCVSVTGYDEQDRPIWQYRVDPFLTDEEHWTYTGNQSEWRFTNYGSKPTVITQEYDAQNRVIWMKNSDNDTKEVYHYRGEETMPYLTETFDGQGELTEQEASKVDADGNRIDNITYYGEWESMTARRITDSHGNVLTYTHFDENGQEQIVTSGGEWSYDDEARTAVCRFPEGTIAYQYDEQGRTIEYTDTESDGTKTTCTSVFNDITR